MTLIASVLHLDRRAVNGLRITDPYSLHRVVYSLFEDIRDDDVKRGSESSHILYADHGGDQAGRRILLLSDRPPAASVDGFGCIQSRPIPSGFLGHNTYRFNTIINPTRRSNASRKLVAVKGRAAIADWFIARSTASWGFSADATHLEVDRVDVLRFNGKNQHRITQAQAHVRGVLHVTDRDQFQHSFARGIGRGRAFGCGLLQLAPISTHATH